MVVGKVEMGRRIEVRTQTVEQDKKDRDFFSYTILLYRLLGEKTRKVKDEGPFKFFLIIIKDF